jgi:hypothetical protein
MDGANDCHVNSNLLKETAIAALALDYFELKSTQQLYGRPFVYSDDSIVVLNIKKEARVG